MAAFFQALPQLIKLISFFVDKISRTPAEIRRGTLIELDEALIDAKNDDLKALSKWLGSHL